MCRITGKEQPSVLHDTRDEAPHAYNVLLKDLPFRNFPAVGLVDAGMQLSPNPIVRPVVDRVFWVALEVHALDCRRARADQGKAAFVPRIDEFFARRRCLNQNSEPTERIQALVVLAVGLRDGRSRGALRAIAADNEIAKNFVLLAILCITDGGRSRIDSMQ